MYSFSYERFDYSLNRPVKVRPSDVPQDEKNEFIRTFESNQKRAGVYHGWFDDTLNMIVKKSD